MNETFFNVFSVSFFSMPMPGLLYLILIFLSLKFSFKNNFQTQWFKKTWLVLIFSILFLIMNFFVTLMPVFKMTAPGQPIITFFLVSTVLMMVLILVIPAILIYKNHHE
jgi:membrane protein YdbS with pleckstrin-like domain